MNGGPEYVLVVDRGGQRSSSGRVVGTVAGVGAVGVLLYLLVKNLGLGTRGGQDGAGAAPPAPPRPRDEQRLLFVMTQPTADDPSVPMSFRSPVEGKTYALDEMIARIKDGGRSDVTLKIAGNVRAGSAESALSLVKQAGIEVWREVGSGVARVAGNARGQYGRPSWSEW
jgi:hypothetical protein